MIYYYCITAILFTIFLVSMGFLVSTMKTYQEVKIIHKDISQFRSQLIQIVSEKRKRRF